MRTTTTTTTTRVLSIVLTLFTLSATTRAAEPPAKQWVWLARQAVWGYGYQVQTGPHSGLWRIDPGSKYAPEELEFTPASDPYGFAPYLNSYRASAGLPPLAYDPGLSRWAAANNAAQASRGLGHHVNPNCFQNSAWNTPDAATTAETWIHSPAHRQNMVASTASRFGIAYGPGPYWTLNLR